MDYTQLIKEWLKGDVGACAFIETLFTILHVVDDVTDGDHPLTTATVHQAFWEALIVLPRNPFYQTHFALLNSTLQTAILNWHTANRLEVTTAPNAKEIAYILRSSYVDLITQCAWLIGGLDWARKVGVDARMHASQEGFTAYLAKLSTEQRIDILREG